MKNYFLKLSFLFISYCFIANTHATHMVGGDVSYTWLGGKKYQFIFKIYRDCRGIPFNNPLIRFFVKSGNSIVYQTNGSFTRTSIRDIAEYCNDTFTKPCKPVNTPVLTFGVEEHVYTGIVDFSKDPFKKMVDTLNACQIYFNVEQCCRNGLTTNISTGNLYFEGMMDICNSNYENSSPKFFDFSKIYSAFAVPYRYNLTGTDQIDFDSVKIESVAPLYAHNSPETYYGSFSATFPVTPYCPPNPGVLNCTALPNLDIPKGFYFNKSNGDYVYTMDKTDEVAVLNFRLSEYRKNKNGTWVLLGYVTRDIQITTIATANTKNYLPKITLNSVYKFKCREQTCYNISTYDTLLTGYDSTNKGQKTSLKILNPLPGMQLSYLDSSANSITGRICWTPHDSIYIKLKSPSKMMPITLELKDNYCKTSAIIRKSFLIKLAPPDSMGTLHVQSFIDANRNKKFDMIENGISSKILMRNAYNTFSVETDSSGNFIDKYRLGNYKLSSQLHPYFEPNLYDTICKVKMDSVHLIQFPLNFKHGIFGRIYFDKNKNCKFDKGEKTYRNIKVYTDSNKMVGLSNDEGLYYLPVTQKKTYTVICDYKPSKYTVNCPVSKSIAVNYSKDSVYENNDFGISQNLNYKDISVAISTGILRRGVSIKMKHYVSNNAFTIARNVKVLMVVPPNIDIRIGAVVVAKAGDTLLTKIDSILPETSMSINYDFTLNPAIFKGGESICLKVFTDAITTASDSLKSNNTHRICRTVATPYDPNEKTIEISSRKTVHDNLIDYTIQFQNVGTDTAFRVLVSDTIDLKYLDPSQFEMRWSEAACVPYITGNILYFVFDNIQLPFESISGDQSISSFGFSLGLKSNVNKEIDFYNKASIYFDFEDAVLTKECKASLVSPVTIVSVSKNTFCENSVNTINFRSNSTLNSNNIYTLEVSDQFGSFNNPTIIRQKASSANNDTFHFKIPNSKNGMFTLRMRTSSPPAISIPDSGLIMVNTLLKPNFLVSTNINNSKLCEADTLKLDLVNSNYYYRVFRNNQSSGFYSKVLSYKYKLKLNDAFKIVAFDSSTECTDTMQIVLTVMPIPSVSLSLVNGPKYCDGDTVQLKANGAFKYSYYNGINQLSGYDADPNFSTKIVSTNSYWVRAYNQDLCYNNSNTIVVNAKPLPNVTINLKNNKREYCNNDSMFVYVKGANIYSFYEGSTLLLSNTTADSLHKIALSDNYFWAKGKDNNACINQSDTIEYRVHAYPVKPLITNTANTLSINYYPLITWYYNGVKTSDTGRMILNAKSGKYSVEVANQYLCSVKSDEYVHQNSGINALYAKPEYNIYPNPTDNFIQIDGLDNLSFEAELYTISGQLILSAISIDGKTSLDLSTLESGMYAIRLRNADGDLFTCLVSVIR